MKVKKENYSCKTIFLFIETNSLTYEIETNDLYDDFHE